jgi:hypothetical protein
MRAVCRPAAAAASSGGRPLLSSLNPPRRVNDYLRSSLWDRLAHA